MNLIIAILGFGFLVLVHELGHYFLARANGVKVEEFSIGMGPTVISKEGKHTKWSIKALPIGGACQMKGEATGEEDKSEDSFQEKSPLRKMSIIAAGPIMNLITALILFIGLVSVYGMEDTVINEVVPDSPAQSAGIMPGDKILSIGGYKTDTFTDVSTGIFRLGNNPGTFKFLRNGETKEVTVTPKLDEKTGLKLIGIKVKLKENLSFGEAFKGGFLTMKSNIRQNLASLKMLVTGQVGVKNLGGPVAVLGMASSASKAGFGIFLRFLAIISVMLAVFNLLPIPALDGGWILMLFIELIRGKKISEKFLNIWNGIGFAFLITLMLLVTMKDVFQIFRG